MSVAAGSAIQVDWPRVRAKAKALLIEQWLLISYFIAATIGLAWPAPGKAVAGVMVGGEEGGVEGERAGGWTSEPVGRMR